MMTVGSDLMKLSPESSLVIVLAHSLVLFVFSSSTLSNFFVHIGLPPIPLVPVSSSQAIVGAVIGIGILKGGKSIKFNVLGNISLGWVLTPLLAGLTSFISLFFVSNVFKIKVAENISNTVSIENIKTETFSKITHHESINLFQPFLYSIIILLIFAVIYLFIKTKKIKARNEVDEFNEKEEKYKIQTSLLEKEIEATSQNNKKLENEVNYKKQELMNFALNIIQKNEFLENLNTKIKSLQQKDNLTIADLNKLSKLIKENTNLDKDRQSFNLYVNKINSEFYYRLEKKYPDLTDNDKRLCALIRLRLSSKEIASLINISPKSVEVNRYRIRKKMNILHGERLSEVISKL
jgi:phosphate/sulfate permease/DNA-binding CsgD family transcriptional regulator